MPPPSRRADVRQNAGGNLVDTRRPRDAATPGRLPFAITSSVGVAVLLAHAVSHLPFISDDAFISLRYSQRLIEGHGLTWTDGPPVEGYTNFLWVVSCAALGALGLDLVDAARALGLVAMSLALLAVAWAVRPARLADLAPSLAATVGLALSGTFAVWAIGGLEQPLVAVFLAWAVALLLPALQPDRAVDRHTLFAGFLLGLLCLSRADGPVVCLGVGLGLLAALGFSPKAWKALLVLAVFPLLLTAGHLVFRYLYYGDIVPNSARVKVALSTQRLAAGSAYVLQGALAYAPLVLPALAALAVCLRSKVRRPRVLLLSTLALVWLAYVAFVGGDIFPARRQWLPALIPAALLAAEWLAQVSAGREWGRAACGALAACILAVLAGHQGGAYDPAVAAARWERWEWDGQALGAFMQRAFAQAPRKPLLAVDPAGALPYYSRLPALDMLGLNDRHIALNRPAEFGRGWMGHELGDGKYVLDRKPDLIVFEVPLGRERAYFLSGRQMQGDRQADIRPDPRFAEFYRLIQYEAPRPDSHPVQGPPLRALIWTRVEDGPVGVRRSADRVELPGFLLAAPPEGVARLGRQGELVGVVSLAGAGRFSGLRLEAGDWRCTVESDGPVRIDLRPSGAERLLAAGESPLQLVLLAETRVDLFVRSSGRAEIKTLVLDRTE